MKILFIEWNSFGNADMKEALALEGHAVAVFPFSNEAPRRRLDHLPLRHRLTPRISSGALIFTVMYDKMDMYAYN